MLQEPEVARIAQEAVLTHRAREEVRAARVGDDGPDGRTGCGAVRSDAVRARPCDVSSNA